MPGFHIEHFGCRAARADGEAIAANLRALAGHRPLAADVVVVNTCSVTAEADRAARAFIRRTHRLHPEARIVVTGCYAQRAPAELARIDGVAAVIGNSHKALAPEIIHALANGTGRPENLRPSALVPVAELFSSSRSFTPIWADERFAHTFLDEAPLAPGEQTRPNLKIQEGCSNRCTFCVIPFTRGPSTSLRADSIFNQINAFIHAGGKELVLSGINLGRWGRDLAPEHGAPRTLAELVKAILEQTALPRLRLSSIEPMDWDNALLDLFRAYGGSRIARHVHIPLQSGSDAVLRRMHRRYRPWHYAEKVATLVNAIGPGLTLGADIMVGFPGETDHEFHETLDFVRELPFGYLHLFPFSPRPGTPAWDLQKTSPVPPSSVEERMSLLRQLSAEKTRSHRSQFLGHSLAAITLHTPPGLAANGYTSALTENYLPVEINRRMPANQLLHVGITDFGTENVLLGHEYR